MNAHQRSLLALVVAIVAALLGGSALTVSVTTDDGGGGGNGPTTHTIHFQVNAKKGDGAPTQSVSVAAPLARSAQATFPDKGMKDETPPIAEQVAPGQLTAAQAAAARIRATQAPLPTAGASAGFKGCVTHFVRNQSSRNGVRPQILVYHYTVSHNVPGRGDVLSVEHLFDSSSAQASSNFIIDAEGNCDYIVPIEAKAWTQAAANPYSVSVEVVAYGNEATYLADPGFRKLGEVSLQVSRRTGIPLTRGAVSGCVPTKKGIIQHADLGICGGGHHDINPFSLSKVIRIVRSYAKPVKPLSAGERKRCRERNTLRRHSAYYHRRFHLMPAKPLTRRQKRRAEAIRRGEEHRHVVCEVGAPHQRGRIKRKGGQWQRP